MHSRRSDRRTLHLGCARGRTPGRLRQRTDGRLALPEPGAANIEPQGSPAPAEALGTGPHRRHTLTAIPMSAPRPTGAASRPDRFGRALLVGAALEALLLGSLLWAGSNTPPRPVSPGRKIIAVHLLRPAPPRPTPSPPAPKPVMRHPLPEPAAQPVPVPTPVPAPAPKLLFATSPAPTAPSFTLPPAIPTPPAQPPPANPAARVRALDLYAVLVRTRVQANLRVPQTIRLMRLSGRTEVAFELQPDGLLIWARIERSSGIGTIDRAALHTVKTTEYPPFTKNMAKLATTFDIEVHISGRRAS